MDSERIEREAADWLAKRDGGGWSEADERAFAAWQDQVTAHRIAVIRLSTIWQKADRLQALGAGVPRGAIPPPESWRFSAFPERVSQRSLPAVHNGDLGSVDQREDLNVIVADPRAARPLAKVATSGWQPLRAWAALLILGLAAAGDAYFQVDRSDLYRSGIGHVKVISLPDGSTVTLNTKTMVQVAFSATERRIELDCGEAFFEVAKDLRRPFVVGVAGEHIVAVGTKFSVRRGPVDTRVVVTEGRVNVLELKDGTVIGPVTELSAGSIAQAGSAGVLVKHGSIAEAETYMNWRSGYITLHDTELATAVAEFNRYNRKQLVIGDPAISTLRIGGNLRSTSVDAFVRVLEEGFPVRAEDLGDRIVLTGQEE
jgi:transmembrane sensor